MPCGDCASCGSDYSRVGLQSRVDNLLYCLPEGFVGVLALIEGLNRSLGNL